jgi:hypothetical protein
MKKIFISCLFLQITAIAAFAQKKAAHPINQFADLSFGIGNSQGYAALSYVHNWQLGAKKKIEIGYGARFTSFFGSKQIFSTAPAKLTSGKTGPGVFFSNNIPVNIDTVIFPKSQVNSLNISINLGYNITPKFGVGFNIDAIGFSFGGNKNGTYYPNSGATVATTAKPTGFNLLLVSDNDKGSLNSEFFAKYRISSQWGVKAAFGFGFTEYTTNTKVQTTPGGDKNDRFRNKGSVLALGVSYNF